MGHLVSLICDEKRPEHKTDPVVEKKHENPTFQRDDF
jgi:hypothetical protein